MAQTHKLLVEKTGTVLDQEVGASDLDHKGNTDPDISAASLNHGDKMSLRLEY